MGRTIGTRRVNRKSYGDGPGRPLPVDNNARIAAGMARAKEAGKHIGRPRKVVDKDVKKGIDSE